MRACSLTKAVLLALAVATGLLPVSCRITQNASAAADPADLLPVDNDISAFLKKGSTAVMTDQQSIFSAIDGEAQRYIDYGFIEGVKQLYSNGSVDIDVQIFNQGNATNAQSIFDRFYPSSPELISEKNPEVVVKHELPNGYEILYTKQSILLRITTTEKSDFALNMAKQFYWNIDKKIPSGQ
jgi:hypothetical protein